MKIRTVFVMASHIAKLEGRFTQLASMQLVMKKPFKVALSLVTLSKNEYYSAVVTSLKRLGDERITWNYTVMRLLPENAQLDRPTALE